MDVIKIDDKKYKIEEVRPEDHIEEYENTFLQILKVIGKLILKTFKFGLYLTVTVLEFLIKLIKVLFNLTDYKPLQSLTEGKESILDKIAHRNINREKIRFSTDFLCRHEYTFPRSDTFLNTYKTIQQRLKDVSDNNINLNNELYKDTIYQINALVVEAEKQALNQGYSYARETKYKLDTSTVYEDFIQEKVMTGESNRKFKEGE